ACLVRIPNRELEAFEVVARLLVRIDRIDEPQRELEHRQEHPELGSRRIAHLREVPLLAVVVGVARIGEEHEAQRIVHAEDVLEVVDVVLVAADAAGETVDRLLRAEVAETEAADGVLTADEETLRLRHAEALLRLSLLGVRRRTVLVERLDVSPLGIEADGRLARQAEELRHRHRRLEDMNRAAQRTAGEGRRHLQLHAARRVVGIVARVERIRGTDRGRREAEVGHVGQRDVAVVVGLLGRFVVLFRTLEAVDDADAVEAVEAIPVGDRPSLAAVFEADRQRIFRVAVENRDAEAVRRIHEPGIGVGEAEEIRPAAFLERHAERFPFAEEVARRELRLDEEAAALRVAAAELNVVLPLFVALDRDVDGLALLIHFELRVLRDLEVAELSELVEALLEGLHVHDRAFIDEDLAAEHLVLRRGVARKLEAAEMELVAFVHRHVHIHDVSVPFDVIGIDVGVDEAARAIRVAERIGARLNRLAANRLPLLDRPVADDLLVREDFVSADGNIAHLVDRAFLHRDDQLDARLLALDLNHFRLPEGDAVVAVVLIEILQVLEIFVELRRDVEILLADPGDDVVRLHFLHRHLQAAIREVGVAGELNRGDLGLDAFVDVEDDALVAARSEILDRRLDRHALVAVLRVGLANGLRGP